MQPIFIILAMHVQDTPIVAWRMIHHRAPAHTHPTFYVLDNPLKKGPESSKRNPAKYKNPVTYQITQYLKIMTSLSHIFA